MALGTRRRNVRVNAPASPYFEDVLVVAMADGVIGGKTCVHPRQVVLTHATFAWTGPAV